MFNFPFSNTFPDLQHLVAILHNGRAMSDENHCLVVMTEYVLKQLALGFRVEGTRCLIEKHDGTVAQQGSGNGNALGLTFAESPTLLRTDGIETLWQFVDEIGTGIVQRFKYLFVGRIKASQPEIIANGTT
jgi:hypothetical protein